MDSKTKSKPSIVAINKLSSWLKLGPYAFRLTGELKRHCITRLISYEQIWWRIYRCGPGLPHIQRFLPHGNRQK